MNDETGITIRPAQPGDDQVLSGLLQQLGYDCRDSQRFTK